MTASPERGASAGSLLVRHDPASAGIVRHEIAADLASRSVRPDSIDDVVLVASELVGNAILHADGAGIDVSWDIDHDAVTVRVSDHSTELPRMRTADDRLGGGRGLAIVAAISTDWGVRPRRSGKQVWARVPITRSA